MGKIETAAVRIEDHIDELETCVIARSEWERITVEWIFRKTAQMPGKTNMAAAEEHARGMLLVIDHIWKQAENHSVDGLLWALNEMMIPKTPGSMVNPDHRRVVEVLKATLGTTAAVPYLTQMPRAKAIALEERTPAHYQGDTTWFLLEHFRKTMAETAGEPAE